MILEAASAEEMTRAGTVPSQSNMIGPCWRAKARSDWCGNKPSWWRFPMIGSLGGEGGRYFLLEVGVLKTHLMRNNVKSKGTR